MLDIKRLEKMRVAGGWTKTTIAKELGVSVSHISHVERGIRGISFKLLGRLLGLYGYELEILAVQRGKSAELSYRLL